MRTFGIVVNIGVRTKYIRKSVSKISYAKGPIFGLSEYVGPLRGNVSGCRIWLYSRQSKREMADTFFHEMTHVFLELFGRVRKQGQREEMAARWIGHLSKAMLADYSKKYARKT